MNAQRYVETRSFPVLISTRYMCVRTYVPFTEMMILLPGIVHGTLKILAVHEDVATLSCGATHRISNNGRTQRRLATTLIVDSSTIAPNTRRRGFFHDVCPQVRCYILKTACTIGGLKRVQ